jgi:nicotinamidase-related amidase
MQHAFGLTIPRTLAEVCNPRHTALLVYDMQMGIVQQAPALKTVIPQVSAVLEAARAAKLRTFFSRHMSLPSELMGISQLRTAMTWQKTAKVTDVKPRFLRDSPGFTLLPEMQPLVIADACGSVDKEARRRALDDIDYTGVSITTDTATICDLLRRAK